MRLTHIAILMLVSSLVACAPEVGSEEWCKEMAEKSKGDWTTNESKEFAKSCVFKKYEDD